MKVIFELDDLWEGDHPEIWHGKPRFDLLLKLKEQIPQLKVTLFASPGLCSQSYLASVAAMDWIQVGMHGWYHTPKECSQWGTSIAMTCLDLATQMNVFTKIFRPPYWAASEGLLVALKKQDWVYAGSHLQTETMQFYKDGGKVFVAGIPNFMYDKGGGFVLEHGHLTEGIANSIDVMFDVLVKQYKDAEFYFAYDEVMKLV